MTDDEKKQVTSLPPPTDDLDKDWSRPSGAPPEPKEKRAAEASGKKPATDPKSDLTPPWKKAQAAKVEDEDEDDEDDEDEDEDEDDEDEDDEDKAKDEDEDEEDEDEDEDEDDEDDEDEDDEDEEEQRKARARAAKAKARERQPSSDRRPQAASPSDDWIPDWLPWAVLGGLLLLGFVGGFGLLPFDFNLKPAAAPEASAAPAASDTTKARPSSSALREQARERRRKALAAADGGAADSTQIRASHLLVAYTGAMRSSQTRTKEEAKARAEEALKRAKKGEDFAKVVASYTDEPGGAERGGDLNKFGRGRMVPAFEEAAFALKVNEISGLVETPFGFHVIKRTE